MMRKTTTDPQNELLTEVDENNKVIGSISRKVAHKSPDKIYRTVYIVVMDSSNKVLIQKRSPTKDLYPNCWDLSVGGHVNYKAGYVETAIRELKEELGLNASKKDLNMTGEILVRLPECKEFFQVFEYKLKREDVVNINKEEINELRWMDIAAIKRSMKYKTLKWYPSPTQVISAFF